MKQMEMEMDTIKSKKTLNKQINKQTSTINISVETYSGLMNRNGLVEGTCPLYLRF